MGSAVSTSLVPLAVIVLSIGAAMVIALTEPDQPATLRPVGRRARRHRRRHRAVGHQPALRRRARLRHARPPVLVPAGAGAGVVAASPAGAGAGIREGVGVLEGGRAPGRPVPVDFLEPPAARTVPLSGPYGPVLAERWVLVRPLRWWERMRSAVVLTVLVTTVGMVVAAMVAGMVLVVVFAVQRAIG
jgi:hypothetical protein